MCASQVSGSIYAKNREITAGGVAVTKAKSKPNAEEKAKKGNGKNKY